MREGESVKKSYFPSCCTMPVLLSLAAPTVETNLYIGPNKSRALTSALHSGERHDASMMDGRTKCITGPGIAYSGFHLKVKVLFTCLPSKFLVITINGILNSTIVCENMLALVKLQQEYFRGTPDPRYHYNRKQLPQLGKLNPTRAP